MMREIDLTAIDFPNDRIELRKKLINLFLEEEPGTGRGENSTKYKYLVLRKDGHDVFLKRPAQFNNGFDFTLNVSGINFNPTGRATTRPTHSNILNDLKLRKSTNLILFKSFLVEIKRIFNCLEPNNINFDFNNIQILDSEILLECIKWLFVEQDVTYWNYSGRAMFYKKILEV